MGTGVTEQVKIFEPETSGLLTLAAVTVAVPSEITVPALEKLATGQERIQGLIEGKTVVKVIAVPGKLVNIVVK